MTSENTFRFAVPGALLLSVGLLLMGCAKELSKEQLERENRDRMVERVSGAKGFFSGGIEQGDRLVPMELDVGVRTVAGSADPAIPAVTMKVGLFGGVRVSSITAIYDKGRNELIARFGRAAGGKVTLELKGTLSEKGFEGTLEGNASGSQRVKLKRLAASTSNLKDNLIAYQAVYRGRDGKQFPHLPSQMTLRLDLASAAAPESFDLDQMPSLAMAFRFVGLPRVSTQAKRVTYDPLVSQMDVMLSDRVLIRFGRLAFEGERVPADLMPDRFEGVIYQDAVEVGTLEVTRRVGSFLQDWVMPTSFTGCFSMAPGSGLIYPVSARVTDLNLELGDPAGRSNILFPSAPALNLELSVLMADGTSYGRMFFKLVESDPLFSELRFRQEKGVSLANLRLTIGMGKTQDQPWSTLFGSMQTPRSARAPRGSGDQGPSLYLTPGQLQGQVPLCFAPSSAVKR